jgi:long-chain fatty acid transport protein
MPSMQITVLPELGRDMANNLKKTTALGLIAACAFVGGAHAGGFSRGEADTDILYEEGQIVGRGGVLYVIPQRSFATVEGAASSDGNYTNNYAIPTFAAKVKVFDNLSCALTYVNAFGADVTYGQDAQDAGTAIHKEFSSDEYATTCDINFAAGAGRLHILGGVFLQDFDYTATSTLDLGGLGLGTYPATLRLQDDAAFGYRLGLGYEITEYALRAQLMYRSSIDHETNDGSFETSAPIPSLSGDAYGSGTLPQSLKLSLQSGVAPGWLVYGSVKWTDWSVMDTLNYTVPAGDRTDPFYWKDGWTFQAGVGHAFTDQLSGTVSLTYDTGVGTGADIQTDTWTTAIGAIYKPKDGIELRVGGAITYLAAGTQSKAEEATINATSDADWAYSVGTSLKIAF